MLIPLPPDGWRMGGRLSKEIINSQSNYLQNCGAGQFSFGSGLWLLPTHGIGAPPPSPMPLNLGNLCKCSGRKVEPLQNKMFLDIYVVTVIGNFMSVILENINCCCAGMSWVGRRARARTSRCSSTGSGRTSTRARDIACRPTRSSPRACSKHNTQLERNVVCDMYCISSALLFASPPVPRLFQM